MKVKRATESPEHPFGRRRHDGLHLCPKSADDPRDMSEDSDDRCLNESADQDAEADAGERMSAAGAERHARVEGTGIARRNRVRHQRNASDQRGKADENGQADHCTADAEQGVGGTARDSAVAWRVAQFDPR
jgi:hypothetical protein